MPIKQPGTQILSSRADVQPFVTAASRCADAHRNALGFLPTQVFKEFAHKECLLVAVAGIGAQAEYAGHLLFDCRFPKGHVLQMLTNPSHRRQGVARMLLDQLKSMLTAQGFIAIQARVAEDLQDSNQFWANQGFYIQAQKRGGSTRNRTILVRSHELATPQLFPASGLDTANPLGLDIQSPEARPLFLLDLNVLFDLGPRRARNEDAVNLFKAERAGFCSLAVSTEITAELKRTATVGRSDPMQDYAKILPTFAPTEGAAAETLLAELAALVFPHKTASDALTANERSDLRHLATVIHHKLAGLITSDGPILQSAAAIARNYRIQVLSPLAFSSSEPSHADEQYETSLAQTLTIGTVKDTDIPAVRELLSKRSLSTSAIANEWLPNSTKNHVAIRCGVWMDARLIGYIMWPTWNNSGPIAARIAVDESVPQSRVAAAILLKKLLEQQIESTPVQFVIELSPDQTSIREAAWSLGFGGSAQGKRLSKISLRRVIIPSSWQDCRSQLLAVSQLKLPEQPPSFEAVDQQVQLVTPDGNRSHVSIENLETLLAPALLCLPGRAAVITPVQRSYSELLLGHSVQTSLLPHSKAEIHSERNYLSDPKTLKHFSRGAIIFFYESSKHKGASAIVAVARVRRAYLKPNAAIGAPDLDTSVLDATTIKRIGASKIKTVTTFDNVIALPNPVSMTSLQHIGCGRPTDLISTRPITGTQMAAILQAGFSRG